MILERVRLESFGHFRQAELALEPGLNILVGPNSAGKSTLLALIRAVLFGFESKSSAYPRYAPVDGGNLAGELEVRSRHGRWKVRRVGGKRASGELSIRAADTGASVAPPLLGEALEGVSRELFFEVFAFGLSELEDFSRLTEQGAVSEALFAAGMGAQRLPQALETLDDAAGAVYAPRAQRPLNTVLKELAEVQQELGRMGDRPVLYLAAQKKLLERRAELARVEHAHRSAQTSLREQETLLRVAEDLELLWTLEERWRPEEAVLESFPFTSVASLAGERAQLASARGELARLAEQRRSLAAGLDMLPGRVPTARVDAATAALGVWTAGTDLRQSLGERRARLGQQLAQTQSSVLDLGLGLAPEALGQLDLGPLLRSELSELAEGARRREGEALGARQRKEELTREGALLLLEREALTGRQAAAVGPSHDALLLQRRQLNEVQAASAELGRRRAVIEALELQAPALDAEAAPARGLLGLREALAFLGAGLLLSVLSGFFLGLRVGTVSGGLFGLLAVLLALLARKDQARVDSANAQMRARRQSQDEASARHAQKLADAQRGLALVEESVAQLARALGLQWPAPANVLAARAHDVEDGLRRAEERERLASELARIEGRQAELAGARRELETALSRRADEDASDCARLRSLLAARALPGALVARAALQLVQELGQAQARGRELAVEAAALQTREGERDAALQTLVTAAAGIGVDREAGETETLAARVRGKVQELSCAEAERTRLSVRIAEVDAELAKWTAQAQVLMEREGELLARTGCRDVDVLAARAAALEELREVRARAREVRQKVEGAGGQSAEAANAALVGQGGAEAAESERQRLDAQASSLLLQLKALMEEDASLRAEIKRYETDTELPRLREREEFLGARARELAQRFAEERLAHELLLRAKRGHERERQPSVVQAASRYFAELTQGAYPRVFTELHAPEILVALDARGQQWTAESLSRGTREQLFLAFRLALVEDFTERRGPLPVLVDDILVNFDPERTALAIAALGALSSNNQVIAFTCHPHVARLWVDAGAHQVDVTRLVDAAPIKRSA